MPNGQKTLFSVNPLINHLFIMRTFTIILSLLLTGFCSLSFAQSHLPIGAKSYEWDNDSTRWLFSSLVTYDYDSQGRLVEEYNYYSNRTVREFWYYDPSGRFESYLVEDSLPSGWRQISGVQHLRTYDSMSRLTEDITQEYVNGVWENTTKILYQDYIGQEWHTRILEEWDNGIWEPMLKEEVPRWLDFSLTLIDTAYYYDFSGANWALENRGIGRYDTVSGAYIHEYEEEVGPTWQVMERYVLSLDSCADNLLLHDDFNTAFIPGYQYEKLTRGYSKSYSAINPVSGNWLDFIKLTAETDYTCRHTLNGITTFNPINGNAMFAGGTKFQYTYDAADRLLIEDYQATSNDPTIWENLRRHEYVYAQSTSVEDELMELKPTFFPNPVTDFLFVNTPHGAPIAWALYDLRGNLVLEKTAADAQDVSFLSDGIYVVKYEWDGIPRMEKIVKR